MTEYQLKLDLTLSLTGKVRKYGVHTCNRSIRNDWAFVKQNTISTDQHRSGLLFAL